MRDLSTTHQAPERHDHRTDAGAPEAAAATPRLAQVQALGAGPDAVAAAAAIISAASPIEREQIIAWLHQDPAHGNGFVNEVFGQLAARSPYHAVTAVSTADPDIALEGALGPEGYFGPLGPFGPLGERGPVESVMVDHISAHNTEAEQRGLTAMGGPGSAMGPAGAIGPSSAASDAVGHAMGWDALGVGGRFTNLGNHGVLGADGVLGGGGPGGFHGHRLTERGYVDEHGQVVRTYVGGDGVTRELTEVYDEAQAKAMSFDATDPAQRPDASMFVVGDIERDGDRDRYPIANTSDRSQAITVQIVPRGSRHSQLEGQAIAGTAAMTGANPLMTHAALAGDGLDVEGAFDNFDLELTDEHGGLIAASTATRRPDWGQIEVPPHGRIYAVVRLRRKGSDREGAEREHAGAAPYALSVTPARVDHAGAAAPARGP